MSWFKRKIKGIVTPTEEKKDIPKGLWYKTPSGKIVDRDELEENLYVSPEDDYHMRIGSDEYFQILFDEGKYTELWKDMKSKDPLKFEDTKKYTERLKAAYKKTNQRCCPDRSREVQRQRFDKLPLWILLLSAVQWVR